MGLFAHRPEEPTEWAGLPSEPERTRSAAERLDAGAEIEIGSAGLFGATAAVESIVIPVAPVIEIIPEETTGEDA